MIFDTSNKSQVNTKNTTKSSVLSRIVSLAYNNNNNTKRLNENKIDDITRTTPSGNQQNTRIMISPPLIPKDFDLTEQSVKCFRIADNDLEILFRKKIEKYCHFSKKI